MSVDGIVTRTNIVYAMQRVDPSADGVVLTAKQVALYSFDACAWHDTCVQGTLYLYSRSVKPWYGIMIMNGSDTNNYMELVKDGLDVELVKPFLLYRNSGGFIYCIWFLDNEDFFKISNYLNLLIKCFTSRKSDQSVEHNTGTAMLNNTLEDNGTASTWSKGITGMPFITGEENQTPRYVMDFFQRESSENNFSDWPNYADTQTPALRIGSNKAVLHELIASPIRTVEQIEMQQRSVKPTVNIPDTTHVKSKPIKHSSSNCIRPQGLFNEKSQQDKENTYDINHKGVQTQKSKEDPFSMALIEQSLYQSFPSVKHDVAVGGFMDLQSSKFEADELMPPDTFVDEELLISSVNDMFMTEPKYTKPKTKGLAPLTKNQLLQAINYLLKNDSDFMDQIHVAYVKSLLQD